jgi:hypothetical protein
MSFPVFASGDVLNASDMNGVGLWLVKSQTIGNGVSSVSVTGAFSADYDAYKIIATNVASTGTGASASLSLNGLSTGYFAAISYLAWGSTTVVGSTDNNFTSWGFAASFSTDGLFLNVELVNPFLARPTFLASANYAAHIAGNVVGKQTSNTSATGFTVTTPSGTMTGGTISVYGYKK